MIRFALHLYTLALFSKRVELRLDGMGSAGSEISLWLPNRKELSHFSRKNELVFRSDQLEKLLPSEDMNASIPVLGVNGVNEALHFIYLRIIENQFRA